MARVERIVTDEAIQDELDIYNPLIPEPGQLCATMFIELTSDEQMREWLPKLVGIERSVVFRLADGVRGALRRHRRAARQSQLTREHVTAAVHYVTLRAHAGSRSQRSATASRWRSITRATARRSTCSPETIAELRTRPASR